MFQLVFHLLQAIELIIGQRVGRALKMGRAPCCDKSGLNKGPWRAEEDQKLIDYIQKHGHGSWRLVPKNAGLARCGKSCRLRWTNYLRPDIKRGRFSFEEEETIIQLHRMLGNKWSAIATHLPGRTDNEIKNYWNTHIRKRLTRMGINPVTHSSNLDLSPLFNPTLLSLCGLLGLQPMVNAELMKLAASLVSSQSQTSGLVNQNLFPVDAISPDNLQLFQTQQQLQDQNQKLIPPTCNTQNAQFPHEGQRPQQGILSANLWASEFNNHISDSYGDPMVEKGIASDHGNLESSSPILITGSVGSNYELQNSWNAASILSTPSSSSKNLNSPSTYMNNNSIEDERDSPCSNIFDFQIPDLLDVSDYL